MIDSPLIFEPIHKETLWGGDRLAPNISNHIGETWQLSAVAGNETVLQNTNITLSQIVVEYKEQLVGKHVYEKYGDTFPLLIKFIDAHADLSIQVHPDDEMAFRRSGSLGKSELWYVLEAEQNARLISGFNRPVAKEEYRQLLDKGQLDTVLQNHCVQAGDIFYLPAGRVHAVGAGIFLAEIQETSDITYRIYDYNRLDSNGNPRQLHTAEAEDVINYNDYGVEKTSLPLSTPHFTVNSIMLDEPAQRDYSKLDSFVILVDTTSLTTTLLSAKACQQSITLPSTKHTLEIYL